MLDKMSVISLPTLFSGEKLEIFEVDCTIFGKIY